MKKYILLLIITVFLSGCNFETPTQFSEKALNETFFSFSDKKSTFKEIIHQYKGKKLLIDVWASWCADCIRGLPAVTNLQKEFPEVVFLFLSVDKNKNAWKRGVKRFQIQGQHYNLPTGMSSGEFVDFINLNWIPRYMVLDEVGNITLFKATKATDSAILEALNKSI